MAQHVSRYLQIILLPAVLTSACGKVVSTEPDSAVVPPDAVVGWDAPGTMPACVTAGTAGVYAVYGNTIEYGDGPWGARAKDTYVLDETDWILYIVPYDEMDPTNGQIYTDRVSLYTCDQLTGATGDYIRTDGLDGSPSLLNHIVVFFDSFGDARLYMDTFGECAL